MKAISLFILFLISIQVFCQDNSSQVYNVVQQMPVYPGGEDSMWKFINTNVKYPDSAIAHNVEGKLIMGFVVNEDGSISDVVIRRGLTADIDSEGMRVIRLLPRFSPGRQDGKAVRVSYTLPIAFKLKSNPADTIKKPIVVEHMPEYPGGDEAMMSFILSNLQYPVNDRENHIQGKVVLRFTITEEGNVADVEVKESVSPDIDEEAIRLIKLLSKFKPGTQQGKPVKLQVNLPILFSLDNTDSKELLSALTLSRAFNFVGLKAPADDFYVKSKEPIPVAWENIADKVDKRPEFPGGKDSIALFLNRNVKYPADANQLGIEGQVILGFIVNEDGHLSDIAFVVKDYQSFNKEAMRVVKLLPNFIAARKDGKPVKALYKLPIKFGVKRPASDQKIIKTINVDSY